MDPEPLQQQLQQLPQGVYFGWAQLTLAGGQPADGAVHKMVMNVGRRPTVNTGEPVEAGLGVDVSLCGKKVHGLFTLVIQYRLLSMHVCVAQVLSHLLRREAFCF
jgi:hypothetical protein